MSLRILMTGGSGQVGRMLSRCFRKSGHAVVNLSRGDPSGWDGRTLGPWTASLEACDVLINLAGRSVDCRYGTASRREMLESRVNATRVLGEALTRARKGPRIWLNASTATIYRHALDRPQDEFSGELGGDEAGAPASWNFSIQVARAWEGAFFAPELSGIRRVALRSAMTMSPDRGGVFDVLKTLVRYGLGGPIGSGSQFVSWIHEYDFCRAVEFLVEHDELDGCVNLASPGPLPNRDFMRELRNACGVPFGLPAYEWMVEIGAFALRTESELVLKSRWVLPARLERAGFQFDYREWGAAARELVSRS